MGRKSFIVTIIVGMLVSGCGEDNSDETTKFNLGESLFNDKKLSANKTMSCATCHNIKEGFIDPRATSKIGASLGDDNTSLGDRNTPTAGYASFSPDFHFDTEEGLFIGGQFLDGRALNLKEQAKAPFLNPIEMGMPDEGSVISVIQENEDYVNQFKTLYGADIFDDTTKAYDALADVISEFEKSTVFASFDSKYDRFLAGSEVLTPEEERGLSLFSDESDTPGAGRCTLCHPITKDDGSSPLMTDFSYDNLGVPVNIALRTANGQAGNLDEGLYANPAVNDISLKGAFKVSSLRNIAVTSPYMHNGVFKDLKTVIHFYNSRDVDGALNPETSSAWEPGEFHSGRNVDELGNLGLSDEDENDIVSFLKTLTDRRYEHLLP